MPRLQFKQAEYLYAEGLSIKYYRLQLGLIQEDLADRCNCQKSLISAIENGKGMNKITELKICFALGIEPWELTHVDSNWRNLKAITKQMEQELRRKRAEKRKKKVRKTV